MYDTATLTDRQRRILAAMDSLPAQTTVKRIGDTSGVFNASVDDLVPLVAAGLVGETASEEPPVRRWSLSSEGRNVAAQIRQAQHPKIRTPEMAAPVPTKPLRERVTKEMLAQAIADGHGLVWLGYRFDATHKGIRELIKEYGLDKPAEQEVQQQMSARTNEPTLRPGAEAPWPPDDQTLVDEAQKLYEDGAPVMATLRAKYGVSDPTIAQRLGNAREHLGLPRKMRQPGMAAKRKEAAAAAIQPPPESNPANMEGATPGPAYQCTICYDSGRRDADGSICSCEAGEKVRLELFAPPEIPPTTPASTEPQAVETTPEGNDTTEQTDAPKRLSDPSMGIGLELALAHWDDAPPEARRQMYVDLWHRAKELQGLRTRIHELEEDVRILSATIEQAARSEAETTHQPLLLLWDHSAYTEATGIIGTLPRQVGDQCVQPVTVDGRQRYNVLTCDYAATLLSGRPLLILTMVHAAAQTEEAA